MLKYSIKDSKIYRGCEAIADIKDDLIDFYEGMAKYRIHAVKEFNKMKEAVKPIVKSVAKIAVIEAQNDWKVRLALIIGHSVTNPHPRTGYRGTKLGDILMKHRNKILDSDLLTKEEKTLISNLYC